MPPDVAGACKLGSRTARNVGVVGNRIDRSILRRESNCVSGGNWIIERIEYIRPDGACVLAVGEDAVTAEADIDPARLARKERDAQRIGRGDNRVGKKRIENIEPRRHDARVCHRSAG